MSPADAQGNVLPDDQVVTCSILPAVLPAVTGQQAIGNTTYMYAVNYSLEYEVILDHTIVQSWSLPTWCGPSNR